VKAHAGVDAMPIPLPAWRGRFAGSLHGAAAIPEAWEAHVAAASRVDLRQIADELGRVAAEVFAQDQDRWKQRTAGFPPS
jgi:hypothetical protein